MKKYLLSSSAFVLACLSLSNISAQNNALGFDGTTSVVNCTNSSVLAATNVKTMECWIKFNSLADGTNGQEILSRSKVNNGIELLIYSSSLSFYCMYNGSSASSVTYPVSNLQTGVWYHIAATWDGSTRESMRLYVNGISVGTRSDYGGNINTTGITDPPSSNFYIGQWNESAFPRYLNASVDEVRVWSINRSATDIKSGIYANYPSNTNGLLAYYKLNETSGTSVINSAATGINGTVAGTVNRFTSPIGFASNTLNFNGTNNKVRVPANSLLDVSTGTVECWIHPSSFSSSYAACLVGNRGAGGTRFSVHASQTLIGLWNGTSWQYLNYLFTAGTWYHVAFVSDASTAKTTIYINGVSIGQLTNVFGTLTGQPLTIGASENSAGDGEWFVGDLDDIRIWNTARTQLDISNNMNKSLNGTETGLVADYTFNTGIASASNAGVIYAMDVTANNLHGVLTNFVLNSTTSNYVSSAVVILPVQLTNLTATRRENTSVLSWATAQEQNTKSFNIQRSADGRQFSTIGSIAASRNTSSATNYTFTDDQPLPGMNYYRLQQEDADGKTSYTQTVSIKFPITEIASISPNPAINTLYYTINSLQEAKASVIILSANGQKVSSSFVALHVGSNAFTSNIQLLPVGTYTLQVLNTSTGSNSSKQFMVVGK